MPTQGKSSRSGLTSFGPEHSFTTPKAARTRATQERLSKIERETDDHRLSQRQKQIDFGKNTAGYLNYVSEVPIDVRSKSDPWTPDIHKKYPKRVWDVIVRTWRRQLHKYDLDAQSSLFKDSPPDSQSHSPLNMSIGSEDDPIDYFNDAIQKFQRGEEMEPQYAGSAFTPSQETVSSSFESSYGYDSSPSRLRHFAVPTSSSQMTPYASSTPSNFHASVDDSNSSMDSMASGTPSFFSESATSEYMSENSSDSWASVPLTPISLLGSPFARSSSASFSSSQSTSTNNVQGFTSSNLSTPFHQRGLRSASQHSTGPSANTPSAFQHYQTPSSSNALAVPSPYGAIGPIPRFSLAAASPSPSFGSKVTKQDENVENTSMWHMN